MKQDRVWNFSIRLKVRTTVTDPRGARSHLMPVYAAPQTTSVTNLVLVADPLEHDDVAPEET